MTKKQYAPGVHTISNSDYHSSAGLSRSALKVFSKSPAHYWHEYINPKYQKPEPTPAMVMGNLVHTLSLEPHLFDVEYAIAPDLNKRTKAGKAQWDEFTQLAGLRTVITQEDYAIAKEMAHSIRCNQVFNACVNDANIEHSIYFEHLETGLVMKARPDIWDGGVVADIKTTADASANAFQRDAVSHGYFLQAAMISEALLSLQIELENFFFICVEKKEPYAVAVHVLDKEAVEYGRKQLAKLANEYKCCLQQDRWPSYKPNVLKVPAYLNEVL